MANRSDRRRKTPCVDEERQSSCKRLGAGARIAHQGPMPIPREASFKRPDIRVQSYLQPSNIMLANEEESIYAHSETSYRGGLPRPTLVTMTKDPLLPPSAAG